MPDTDMRWIQRLNSLSKALSQLRKFIEKGEKLNELEEQGLIKAFEYTYELAWLSMKDFYESQGETNLQGSRDVFQLAFKRGLILDGEIWMQMLKDRNRTAHTYNEKTANEIASAILNSYFNMFLGLQKTLNGIKDSLEK